MARYCVHLDGHEFEVEVNGDEADAIRTARELNNISEVRDQRAHRIADLAPVLSEVPDVVPPTPGDSGTGDAPAGTGDGDGSGAPAAPVTPAAPVPSTRTRRRAAAPKAE